MLIIEIDGGQHLSQVEYDNERTKFLNAQGYKVLRFWNDEVLKDLDIVLDVIVKHLNTLTRR
jgi:very-short-patch-repair endonuclease